MKVWILHWECKLSGICKVARGLACSREVSVDEVSD